MNMIQDCFLSQPNQTHSSLSACIPIDRAPHANPSNPAPDITGVLGGCRNRNPTVFAYIISTKHVFNWIAELELECAYWSGQLGTFNAAHVTFMDGRQSLQLPGSPTPIFFPANCGVEQLNHFELINTPILMIDLNFIN